MVLTVGEFEIMNCNNGIDKYVTLCCNGMFQINSFVCMQMN